MANMPGFAEACELTHEHKLNNKIGLHLNLTTGYPLSERIRKQPRLCSADGEFRCSIYKGLLLSQGEATAIYDELVAQWNVCRMAGIEPSHMDSHHHTHLAWGIAKVVVKAAGELGIPAVRIHWNAGTMQKLSRRVYGSLINWRYRRAHLQATRYMVHSRDGRPAIAKGLFPIEIMVHPTLAEDGSITDYYGGRPLRDVVEDFGDIGPLMSFHDLLNMTRELLR